MIDYYRKKIDEIDKEIIKLYEKRLSISTKIGDYKKQNNIPILNKNREEEIIKKNLDLIYNEDNKEYIKRFLNFIMSESKKYQKNINFKED